MKRTRLAVCLMGIVFGAAACSETPVEPATGPAAPAQAARAPEAAHAHGAGDTAPLVPVRLSFAPGDLSSDVGATPLTVFAEKAGQAVDDEVLEKLAAELELRTYPEMEPVEVEIDIVSSVPEDHLSPREGRKGRFAPSEAPRDHAGRASLVVRPLRPLSSRWYVLSLATLPAGAEAVAWTGATDTLLGAFAARFHPGSQPVLREVRLCEKQQGAAARVVATFSEGMRIDPADAAKLARAAEGQSGEACTVVTPAARGLPQTMVEIDCPASVLKTGSIELGLEEALTSMSGAPLSSIEARGRAAGFQDTIDFSEASEVSGCRTLVMQ